MVRIDQAQFGCSRDEAVELLVAEGVPAYRGYRAIPDLDIFHEGVLWPGQPPVELTTVEIEKAMRRHPVPVSRAVADDVLWLHHTVLLGEAQVQDAVAEAFRKISVAHASASRTSHDAL